MHKHNKENMSYVNDTKVGEEEMPKKPVSNYYRSKQEAENHRKRGERIYKDKGGYYIRRPQIKKSFWEEFFGL